MCEFKIPQKDFKFFTFKLESERLMLAGSRHFEVDGLTATSLVKAFGSLGFSFMTDAPPALTLLLRKH